MLYFIMETASATAFPTGETNEPTNTSATLYTRNWTEQMTLQPAVIVSPSDRAYIALTIITGVLSMFGCITIIGTYIAYKDIQTTSRKLLVYLSLADFLTAFGNTIGVIGYLELLQFSDHSEVLQLCLCEIPTGITLFSSMSSFWWTGCIAVYLYICIVKSNHGLAEKLIIFFHVLSWIIPAVIAIVAAAEQVLGYDNNVKQVSWCWIRGDLKPAELQLLWQFITGPVWQIISLLVAIVLYALIKCHIRKEMNNEHLLYVSKDTVAAITQANNKLTFVPIVFVLLRIWGTIRFLVDIQENDKAGPALQILQAIGDSGQGFANAILFCLCTPKIRSHLVQSLRSRGASCKSCCTGKEKISTGILGRSQWGSGIAYNQLHGSHIIEQSHIQLNANERTPIAKCQH